MTDQAPKSVRRRIEAVSAGILVVILVVTLIVIWRGFGSAPPSTAEASAGRSEASLAEALDAAGVYLHGGEAGKAVAILREAVGASPERPDLRLAYAESLLATKSSEQAYEQYVAAISLGADEAPVEFAAGTLANVIGRPEAAQVHYASAQAADPTNPEYPLYLAQVQIKLNQIEEAKANLMIAARLDETSAIAWGTLADLALRQNTLEIALLHIDRARSLQPRYTPWRLIEARVLKRKGNPEEALLVLSGLDESERRHPQIMKIMAECYGLLGRPSDAADLYVNATESSPTDADLAYETALWLQRAGREQEAIGVAKRAAMLGHDGAASLANRMGG